MRNRKLIIGISILVILVAGYLILDSMIYNGVKSQTIIQKDFQANYYSNPETTNKAAVVLIGGGQWGDYWGEELVRNGFVGLSVPYTGLDGLPKLPEEIPLEYFENAIKWLREQPEVNANKIIVMGASRNAELALVIASSMPGLVNGAIAYAPSSVSWSNTVLPYNSDVVKPSWTYKGKDIPYIPMDKISGSNPSTINTLEYWENGLNKAEHVKDAAINVENINGPVLLISGKEDKVWPSSRMADMMENRLKENNFKHHFENIQYENAGHLISGNPESKSEQRTGNMTIQDKQYVFQYGGTNEGDYKAKQDAKKRVLQLINNL